MKKNNVVTLKCRTFQSNGECARALFKYLVLTGKVEDSEYYEDMILHDINNLRGDEWLELLEQNEETKSFFDYLLCN